MPPGHRIPLYIAAYRKEFVALAGQKADGYLARPAESIPSLRGILERLAAAATAAGRDPREIESTGYLLSLVDETRREALNRAKREPFVIYMMSVLGDVSLRRAGFELELRDRIAAAWRAEEFHEAGKLIPDELLDAFILCGTREDVAAGAARYQDEASLELPLLQPVVQEEAQITELLAAAMLYGESRSRAAATAGAGARPASVSTIVVLGLIGLVFGYFYTAPPFEYKSRALGVPLVFLLMGPLMVEGAFYAITGSWSLEALVLSVPVGLLAAAILHGNEWRDISEDTRAGIVTLSSRIGRDFAHYGYISLVVDA